MHPGSSCSDTPSKNNIKTEHKNIKVAFSPGQKMQEHPMHVGGGAAPSPQPSSSLFF